MMGDFRSFARNLRSKADRLDRNVVTGMKGTITEIHSTVVIATPADRGTAKSNWQIGLGSPAQGILPAYVPGSKGSTSGANERAAIDKAAGVIAQYKPGNNVHLTNNVPYIGLLNSGSSTKAPAGFVEQAILRGRAYIKTKFKLLKG